MKVSASGQSIREVLLSIKAQGDPGNAQRVKQEAQRIKKAEDDLNKQRSGRTKQSDQDLTKEEKATASYHLARMRREKEYANERKRLAREQEQQQERIQAGERKRQQEIERAEAKRRREQKIADNEQLRWGATVAREYDQRIAREARDRKKAEQEQLRWGSQVARDYDKRINDQKRTQEKAARDAARATIAAEREQLRMGAAMAREYERNIAARARTRREFAAAADVRHGRSSRLGVAGIGQDAIGVMRGVGHIGVASGLFGDSTESILDALLAVEGGFNVARYGAPLLTNLARTRGVRGQVLGGARRLSGLLGIGAGVGGSAAGTALGGTVGLLGAGAGAVVGGGLGAYAGVDFVRQAWNNGIGGGAAPGSYSDTVASAGVNALRGRPGLRGFVRGASALASFGLSEYTGSPWGAMDDLDRTDARLKRQQFGAEDIRRWAMGDEARFMSGMAANMAGTGSLLLGSGPMLERQLSQNQAQRSILGGSLSALAQPGDPQSGYMMQGQDRAQALEELRALKQQEVAIQEQMHARDMAHWRSIAQIEDAVLQKRMQEKAIVEDQVRSRASALSEMSPGQLRRLEQAYKDATDGDGKLSNLNRSLLNRNRGLIPGDLPELDRANLDRARGGAPMLTGRIEQELSKANAAVESQLRAVEDFSEKMAAVQEKSTENLRKITEEAVKVITRFTDEIKQAIMDMIDEAVANGSISNGQGVRAPGRAD